jgi:hypothetical protein
MAGSLGKKPYLFTCDAISGVVDYDFRGHLAQNANRKFSSVVRKKKRGLVVRVSNFCMLISMRGNNRPYPPKMDVRSVATPAFPSFAQLVYIKIDIVEFLCFLICPRDQKKVCLWAAARINVRIAVFVVFFIRLCSAA